MRFATAEDPQTVAYCHCADCRRWTGAPMPAFAAFAIEDLRLNADVTEITHASGVARRNCPACGSPLTARFPYLPDQIYVPVGLLDDAKDHPPVVHCHVDAALPWVHTDDDLLNENGSARDTLGLSRK
ncbi:GFA family protein [Sulfitobacter aestuariivivens]|uniref:GFA family protein n=1 Tax=Sulfitobacter aestuariivivens TaxID=2766981 RepID=UPI0036174778